MLVSMHSGSPEGRPPAIPRSCRGVSWRTVSEVSFSFRGAFAIFFFIEFSSGISSCLRRFHGGRAPRDRSPATGIPGPPAGGWPRRPARACRPPRLGGGRIPEPHGAVERAAHEVAPVRQERQARRRAGVPGEIASAGIEAPDADGAILACRRERLPVGGSG